MATSHSLRSLACHTITTRRPAGRSARPTLANAATGSSKNIVPNLLIARSKRSRGKRWTCASACSKVTFCTPWARVLVDGGHALEVLLRARHATVWGGQPVQLGTAGSLPVQLLGVLALIGEVVTVTVPSLR